jgi:hypothetical protein
MRIVDGMMVAGAGAKNVVGSRSRPLRAVPRPSMRLAGKRLGKFVVLKQAKVTPARRRALGEAAADAKGRWYPASPAQRAMARQMAGDGLGLWLPAVAEGKGAFQLNPVGRWALKAMEKKGSGR